MDKEKYVMVNTNEQVVKMLATDLMGISDMCRCEKCYMDVCALALNTLKGHYVTSRKGEKISTALIGSLDNKIELTVAVVKAIELVKGSPMHAD